MTDYTLLPEKSSFAVHYMHDVTSKEASPLTNTTADKLSGDVNKKIKHASLSVVRHPRCGIGCRPTNYAR